MGEKVIGDHRFLLSDRHLRCEAESPLFNFVNLGLIVKLYNTERLFHIESIYKDNELFLDRTCKYYLQVQIERQRQEKGISCITTS